MYLLEKAGKETERVADVDRPWPVKPFETLVRRAQSCAHFTQDNPHPAERVPEIRVFRHSVEFFDRDGLFKDEAGLANDLGERSGGKDDDFVTACPERTADAYEGVHVAGGSNRSQNETHRN
jgi:hypothetical protein